MVVGGGVHRLGQVDHHRPVGVHQHVEFGQVAVDQPGAQHQHHVVHHQGVVFQRLFLGEHHVAQARRHVAGVVGDQLHQQHAFQHVVGPGHAHAGVRQAAQGVHFGGLPDLFLLIAAELGALFHGPGTARAAHLAALLVVHRLLEAALGGLLVHLGALHPVAAADHIDVRLFAAHQPADHFVHQAVVDQGLYPFRGFHAALIRYSPMAGIPWWRGWFTALGRRRRVPPPIAGENAVRCTQTCRK